MNTNYLLSIKALLWISWCMYKRKLWVVYCILCNKKITNWSTISQLIIDIFNAFNCVHILIIIITIPRRRRRWQQMYKLRVSVSCYSFPLRHFSYAILMHYSLSSIMVSHIINSLKIKKIQTFSTIFHRLKKLSFSLSSILTTSIEKLVSICVSCLVLIHICRKKIS